MSPKNHHCVTTYSVGVQMMMQNKNTHVDGDGIPLPQVTMEEQEVHLDVKVGKTPTFHS